VRIASIPTDAMPYDTALAVDTNGNAWGWGDNDGGELCLGNKDVYRTPAKLPLSAVTELAGASTHAMYDSGGTVYACGQDLKGDLGIGRRGAAMHPTRVVGIDGSSVVKLVASFANSGALMTNGTYYDWGFDGAGQLGDGHLNRSSEAPVRVHLPHPVAQVALGGSIWDNGQTLVILSDGSLYSWGNDRAGQLGNRRSGRAVSPVRFSAPAGVTYARLATGAATSYAISTTGDVYAWGVSHVGQAGDGLMTTAVAPVLIATGAMSISSTANNAVVEISRTG
jgi:alpha-tubulin suppressor-like RCC1 family protein